jgi:molybdopterin biosynthesis enzyme MoaB
MAEVVAARYGGTGRSMRDRSAEATTRVVEVASTIQGG